jgi:AraC-like DNA-binding protein
VGEQVSGRHPRRRSRAVELTHIPAQVTDRGELMVLQTHFPTFPLNQFIEVLIYFEGLQYPHKLDRFLPNGDTEILISLRDATQFIYDNDTLEEIQACRHVWASGLRTAPITIPSGTGAAMMVIAFKKGQAAPFFPFPMNEIADRVIDGDSIWHSEFTHLREKLLETPAVALRFRIVERFLLNTFRARLETNACVAFAVREMTNKPDQVNIARMNAQIGYSPKHFIDMFRRHVGVTPKSYLKIMRFQKALQLIDSAESIDWRRISLDCGFYDQAHFIHDFRHFSGFTPEQYAKIQTSYQNYLPVA